MAHINDDAAEKLRGVTVKEKDVLLNITGDSVARTCVVPNDVLPARVNQHVAIIRPKQSLNSLYLNYYLASPAMQGYLLNIASTGASRNAITKAAIEKLVVPVPEIGCQQQIANVLSAYDNLIENNNKRIKTLEQMAENLYKEWFVRFHFPGHETTPFENGIPRGWSINRFDTAATLINGRAYLMPELLSEGKYRIVRVGNFSGKDEWFYSDMELESDKYCEQGDLLYKWACNFGPEIWNEEKVIYHYHIWKVVPKNNVNKAYLYFYLKTSTPLWMGGTNGTAMVHITKESMEKKKMVVPPKSILDQFDNIVGPMIRNRLSLLKHNENLIKQRDLLLPRLMSGKLAV